MFDACELRGRRTSHALCGRVRCDQRRVASFEVAQLPVETIEVAIRDFGPRKDVVKVFVPPNLFPEVFSACRGFRGWGNLRCQWLRERTKSGSASRASRTGDAGNFLSASPALLA